MGGVDAICTGKSGTLTRGDMKVMAFYTQSKVHKNFKKNSFLNCGLDSVIIDAIKECILWCCESRVEVDTHAYYRPVGNATECALIYFLQQNEITVHDLIRKKRGRIETMIPFNSELKRMLVAVRHPDDEDLVRVFVKGAPEIVVRLCEKTIEEDGRIV